ncbi:DNA cytosine methyltransferase [Sphingomonas beigongshangi]|uniref:DNA cytosine methyltransferase n=1 Tax=Sphingomonas beigongshangi TaxID=2782540 RepID=UPI00193B0B4D|nr:DNA cytosine methyltransferase [Sphingomonas beigongshangi]
MSGAYYNEIDPDAAHIMRALIADGVLASGEVDTRPIQEVAPDDLRSFTQCHFFAGGGLWSVAARLAGWPDDRELWTGSCPCQPFSIAGKGGGAKDPRHLWPDFLRLIGARRPAVVVGEQVAGPAGYGWLDGVRADLAGEGYASRGVDIPACAVDAPHIRSRLYWCAVADPKSVECGSRLREDDAIRDGTLVADGHGCDVVYAAGFGWGEGRSQPELRGRRPAFASANAPSGYLGHTNRSGASSQPEDAGQVRRLPETQREPELSAALPRRADGRNGSWWADHDWIACHDGKARRTEPGARMLVDGLPGRVGLWRVAGNAISPILAAEVIGALMDTLPAERLAA